MAQSPPTDPFLPGAASIVDQVDKQVLLVLRDGRKIIGILRTYDQFANIVLQDTIERVFVGGDDVDSAGRQTILSTQPPPPSAQPPYPPSHTSNGTSPTERTATHDQISRTNDSDPRSQPASHPQQSTLAETRTSDGKGASEARLPTPDESSPAADTALRETEPSPTAVESRGVPSPSSEKNKDARTPLLYGDIPRGVFVIRGENVVLLAEMDPDAPSVPPEARRVSPREILTYQREVQEAKKKSEQNRRKILAQRGIFVDQLPLGEYDAY
ncbi:LSM-domain-containing protein [Gonapodya prolifera JEL478]|uniref:U6 snRNA-associated Sm-like protein LSm1 n=1 Tax=Gonapodya prolifera (strain JEL478) TaxID=1344416 RepID=A0A139A9P0_GONPJ|nr:LSM-domain-containing protein [Gonapodya prolifera JEL478]|eukprot:KXS13542.1 LSM-domain-containing protein [Gonapodya prolifera JEL478]